MSLWADFVDDVRLNVRPVAKWATILGGFAAVAFLVSLGIAVAVARQSAPDVMADIPAETLPPAILDVFACVQDGPVGCSEYDQATAWLVENTQSEGASEPDGALLYTPLHPDDPGLLDERGLHRVTLTTDTAEVDWQRIAAAVTLNGRATPDTISDDTVEAVPGDAQAATFAAPATEASPALTGTMHFEYTDDGPLLLSVVYSQEG